VLSTKYWSTIPKTLRSHPGAPFAQSARLPHRRRIRRVETREHFRIAWASAGLWQIASISGRS
jgi:hypothetical protein